MGDPHHLDDMAAFQAHMLEATYAVAVRNKIDDTCTQSVSAYNPDGLENADS